MVLDFVSSLLASWMGNMEIYILALSDKFWCVIPHQIQILCNVSKKLSNGSRNTNYYLVDILVPMDHYKASFKAF